MLLAPVLALLLACRGDAPAPPDPGVPGAGTEQAARPRGVVVRAPTYEARVEAAWKQAPSVALSRGGTEVLADVGTDVAVDVPGALSGLPEGVNAFDLGADAAIRGLLLGTDDRAVAMALRERGIKSLVVHSALRPSMDRDRRVLSRLYHHDALDFFQLLRVEDGALVYLIVDDPLQLPPQIAETAVAWLRERIAGRDPAPYPAVRATRSNWRLVASLRGQGQELAFSLAEAETLDVALVEVARDLEIMHRRQREILGFPPLREHVADLVIELHRVTERAYVVPRDEATLEDLWELGIDGAILLDVPSEAEKRAGKKLQKGVWPGSVAATRGVTRAEAFLRGVARDFRWDNNNAWRDEGVQLYLIRTQHWAEVPGKGVVPLYRGTSPVPLEFVNLHTTRDAIVSAGEWYLANLQPDGQVTYKFWPEENRWSGDYNHVRHALAVWNLWQAWTLDPRPEFLEGAIRARDWTLDSVQEKDGMAFMPYGGKTKLGSVVVLLLGMIEVARATDDHSQDELIRKLGAFVMFMQAPSGTFRGYWDPATGQFVEQVNDIVPGEAALSLVALHEYFQDPKYLEPLPKFFAYYEPWFEERAKRRHDDAPWPAHLYDNQDRLELVQFGPWTVMAANAYTRVRPEEEGVAAFGLKVARWMIESYEYTSERAPWPDYVGGYYKFEGELPAMQAFCYGEGTAAAYDMALRVSPEEAPFFERHTREVVRLAFQMQHDALDTRAFSRPLLSMGGVRYALNQPKVRIDYVYHAQSAMFQWLKAAEKDPALPAVAKAEPDAAMAGILRQWDLPGTRDPGLPKWRPGDPGGVPGEVVRTSVPSARGAGRAPVGKPEEEEVESEEAGE